MDSSFCPYTVYVGNCGSSLERTRQTTADSVLEDWRVSLAM